MNSRTLAMMTFAVTSTVWAAPLVRLDEAEVGFRMHLGVMKTAGLDISND